METLKSCKMSWLGIAGIGLTLFNSWVIFEETIVDRHGLDRFLPHYRVGQPCVWDLTAALVIAAGSFWFWRSQRRKKNAEG